MPGCAILVMRNNRIVYEKGFGHNRYGQTGEAIDPLLHTYDLASLTKVTTTTLCAMRLYEERRLNLDEPIATYLPDLKGTNLAKLTSRRLLQHNAGLPAWIPFYLETFSTPARKSLDPRYYSYARTPLHTLPIAPDLYAVPAVRDSIWARIMAITPRNTTRMRYSDVGMILMARIIESIVGVPIDVYAGTTFYAPLGMDHTCFNPFALGKLDFCPPSEADTVWRQAIIQGFVNDQTAALLGGVAGHAGLFSNVYDLAKLMTMLANNGTYGDQALLDPATIRLFTRRQLEYSRKGLGWDKPEIQSNRPSPVSATSSAATFGHTGFTGTAVWVDPSERLVYVFLSNRTYPYPGNRLLLRENVRGLVMDQIYASIHRFDQKKRYAGSMN
jgi:beta-N-acetylhexosaminidase